MFRIALGLVMLVSAITGLGVQAVLGAVGIGFLAYGAYAMLGTGE